MKRILLRVLCLLCVCLLLAPVPPAGATVESNAFLEAAFSMLEKDNFFLEQYDLLGDNLTEARYDLGVPYFYGGRNESKLLSRMMPQQTTRYYVDGRIYLYGFDCKGFANWVQREAGAEVLPPLSDILYQCRNDQLLEGRPAAEWPAFFQVGDYLVVDHGSNHILMYIGVPEDYGLTAENAPEIADYLHCPLMIHCGYNPFYTDRYAAYISEMGYRNTSPPDGGVTVSLLGVEAATNSRTDRGRVYDYFMVMGQPLSVFHLNDCTRMAWVAQEGGRDDAY